LCLGKSSRYESHHTGPQAEIFRIWSLSLVACLLWVSQIKYYLERSEFGLLGGRGHMCGGRLIVSSMWCRQSLPGIFTRNSLPLLSPTHFDKSFRLAVKSVIDRWTFLACM